MEQTAEVPSKKGPVMQKQSLAFLRNLIDTPSPSGYEMRIHEVISERMKTCCAEVKADICGNTIGVINPDAVVGRMSAGH